VASKLPPENVIYQARVWAIFLICAVALVFTIGIASGWWMKGHPDQDVPTARP
jgi:hypothetical protein